MNGDLNETDSVICERLCAAASISLLGYPFGLPNHLTVIARPAPGIYKRSNRLSTITRGGYVLV